ncbi:MAG: tRNA (N6-isopentenyl adenosine(37)-C2)-methylthiotransferase MiaB [Acutalibacteraceae bacterium]|nr:tRNA (N6-isopentenyl adenosine(37)-C2)-methylthiotransferase MiaB [Acutalibacteraceae bacterium]
MSTEISNQAIIKQTENYITKVREILPTLYSHTPLACVNVYGCQQNVSDGEKIKGLLEAMGYTLTEDYKEADFVLFHTCAVRGHAEDRVLGNVGRTKQLKKDKGGVLVAVSGCMSQQQVVCDKIKKSYPYVDIVFGTHHVQNLPEYIYKRLTGSGRIFDISDGFNQPVEGLPVHRDGSFKGWLPIMHGCDNFCTYCIVPYVRGRECSRTPENIIAEAEEMIAAGFKEIMLLGQNVNSYGKGLDQDINFAKLLRRINDIPGDFRIRFMTSHPKDCTTELLDAVAECEKVEKHLHLPFQSGSDRVLKAMNRKYDSTTYLNLIAEAKKRIPGVTFTSDIIVGFPGETYEDFRETLRVVDEVKFQALFTFIFSPRKGTVAETMPDPISREEKGKWFDVLLALQEDISKKNYKSYVGTTHRVLCDEILGCGRLSGKTSAAVDIQFEGSEELLGQFVEVRVDSFTNLLNGTII